MVEHHYSYRQNKTVEFTRKEHFYRHFGFGPCFICRTEGRHKRYFAPVNPRTGKGYDYTFIHPDTGNLNHAWTSNGKWVLICDGCRPKAIGIRITRN